jgi:exopolysaccharide biosynthesis protein
MRRAAFALVLLAGLALAQRPAPDPLATAAWQREEVGEGVRLSNLEFDVLFGAPQSIAVLEIERGVRVDVVGAAGRELTTRLAARAGALAAVNGGFFDTKNGDPVGLLKVDGALVNPANEGQGSLGIDARGRLSLGARPAGDWPPMVDALGAGPMLVTGGRVVDHGERQRTIRHPRTAIGLRGDGDVVMVVVDGRNAKAAGMSFEELGAVMVALGCVEALNLDGGGSSTMWVAGPGIVNHPCDNKRFDAAGERTVANAVLVSTAAVRVVDEEVAVLEEGAFELRDGVEDAWRGDLAVGTGTARWRLSVPRVGRYRVFARWPAVDGVRAGKVEVRGGGLEVTLDQRGRRGRWNEVGEVVFGAEEVELQWRAEADRDLLVDALRLVERR